jgi:hypothetical protein
MTAFDDRSQSWQRSKTPKNSESRNVDSLSKSCDFERSVLRQFKKLAHPTEHGIFNMSDENRLKGWEFPKMTPIEKCNKK